VSSRPRASRLSIARALAAPETRQTVRDAQACLVELLSDMTELRSHVRALRAFAAVPAEFLSREGLKSRFPTTHDAK
jgi:hypothetical protein